MFHKTCLSVVVLTGAFLFSACQSPNKTAAPTEIATTSGAGLRLPNVFSHNMVLQQNQAVPVWGWGDNGDTVIVTFQGQTARAKVVGGKWMVHLQNLKAGGPQTFAVTEGRNTIQFTNVLVGEVFVASGQSNMEFALQRANGASEDITNSANPMIHLLHVPRERLDSPTNDIGATWTECNPQTSPGFSAVAYYFARDLQKARGVPIGIIESSWGGTPCEAWTRSGNMASNPKFQKEISEAAAAQKTYQEQLAGNAKKPAGGKGKNKAVKAAEPRKPWIPGELYNGMIAPLIPYAIKGAIWYQGENNASNTERAWRYHEIFPNMIRNWREDWDQGDFTFLLVQLAPFKPIEHQPGDSDWASVREAQWWATKTLPKVGMAVITDVGEEHDIHPTKKQPVGARLALAARAIAFGENVEFSGPLYKNMKVAGNKAVLSFDHVGYGLESRNGALKGFSICGEDKKFVWALAEIDGDKVVVSSPNVQNPVAVRYGWADYPVVNLWNKNGLPATPFRTDEFELVKPAK
jgi:sialate O-acetylesterase